MKLYIAQHHALALVWMVEALVVLLIELTGVFFRRSEATQKDRGSRFVLSLFAVPGAVSLVLFPRFVPAAEMQPPLPFIVIGFVAFAAGEALRVWSRSNLGRYFTYVVMTSRDQPVISSGPYRVLRHPSYSGVLMIYAGVGLVFGNWLGLAALLAATGSGLMYRITIEERALNEELGDAYRDFARTRKRLIPFVW